MPTRKTMVVPCIVNSRLNSSGMRMPWPGQASCQRIIAASSPPMIMKISPDVTYMMPSFLRSTVATHSCMRDRNGTRRALPNCGMSCPGALLT